jgi:hypothetical protein
MALSESATTENFLRLCRIYGKINPEETHVVLFYVPHYVKEVAMQVETETEIVKHDIKIVPESQMEVQMTKRRMN